ncbi:hypothetical protein CSKR_103250 [Clonorchis sinensis]|uniref:Uncharacterized protein n=1 Tax=Clonorchis sinensis TaxID=79923 RepID=A0A419Q2J1_CLOSI|nr:hypothetical protein CSKR_103250 [Clonorchis sinensis]
MSSTYPGPNTNATSQHKKFFRMSFGISNFCSAEASWTAQSTTSSSAEIDSVPGDEASAIVMGEIGRKRSQETLPRKEGWRPLSANLLTGRSIRTRPLGLSNLAVSEPSCFLLAVWQLGAEMVLQLNDSDDILLNYLFTTHS